MPGSKKKEMAKKKMCAKLVDIQSDIPADPEPEYFKFKLCGHEVVTTGNPEKCPIPCTAICQHGFQCALPCGHAPLDVAHFTGFCKYHGKKQPEIKRFSMSNEEHEMLVWCETINFKMRMFRHRIEIEQVEFEKNFDSEKHPRMYEIVTNMGISMFKILGKGLERYRMIYGVQHFLLLATMTDAALLIFHLTKVEDALIHGALFCAAFMIMGAAFCDKNVDVPDETNMRTLFLYCEDAWSNLQRVCRFSDQLDTLNSIPKNEILEEILKDCRIFEEMTEEQIKKALDIDF
ncbi:unnamed protein product [Caenorhabditis auriculariae]|uniref:Uncharacterized protein n=1 Tax=Caenorhabditis auriculariae TaxID=2777116 RepID=A0A8S1HVK5_9PELO|nr:unnamed protein product [Caenorhabditis auriculariae]